MDDYIKKLVDRYHAKPEGEAKARLKERIWRLAAESGKNPNDVLKPKPSLKLLQGGKKLSSLPVIGTLLGLAAPDMAEAVLPTGDVHTDKAIEDPSSPEFKKRRSLWDSLEGK